MTQSDDADGEIGARAQPRRAGSVPASTRRKRISPSVAVFAAYLLLTLALTYPLIMHMATHIPGGNVDEGAFLWNIWWMQHALLDLRTNPLMTSAIFYPLGVNLALYTLTPLNGILALPLTLVAGPIVAVNVLTILAFALAGLGMYLLALDVAGNGGRTTRLAAFSAGLVYTFASARFVYASLGQYDYVHVQWLPLAVLFLLRSLRRPGLLSPLLGGFFLACSGLTEMNYVVFLFIFALLAATLILRREGKAVVTGAAARRLGLVVLVFLVGFGPLGFAVVRETLEAGDYLVSGWGGANQYVVDLLGPVLPSSLSTVFGEWAVRATRRFTDINFGFIGYLALALSAAAAIVVHGAARRVSSAGGRSRPTEHSASFWLAVAISFLILSFGPFLHINGAFSFDIDALTVSIPLPYIVIHYIPILKGARIPGRFAIMATLAAAVLVSLSLSWILLRLRTARRQALVTAIISLVIVGANLSVPLPLTAAVAPPAYQTIAAQPGDFSIMQIPLGWRDGFATVGHERTILQSYQSIHEKSTLSGNTSRSPAYTLTYFATMPVVQSIVALEEGRTLGPGAIEADRALVPDLLRFLDLRYIVVHGDYVNSEVERYINAVFPVERTSAEAGTEENSFWRFEPEGKYVERRTENAGWVLYAVHGPPAGDVVDIDFGAPISPLYLPAGWSRIETSGGMDFRWAEAQQALVLVRLGVPADTTLALHCAPFSYEGAPQQSVDVEINGHRLGRLHMQEGWVRVPLAGQDVGCDSRCQPDSSDFRPPGIAGAGSGQQRPALSGRRL